MTNEMQPSQFAPKKQSFLGHYMKTKLHEAWKNRILYLFMLPFMLVFITLTVLPVVTAIYYGFTYFNILEQPKFIFWDNYTRMFIADDLFMTALKNTMLFAVVLGPGGYILSLFFAWLINGLLRGNLIKLGLITSNIRWLEDVNYIVPCVMIVLLWSSLGVSFLTFIAGLQNVDKTLYEAAALDGVKNRWQELWYVTLPYMRPQMVFSAIMSITGAFSVGDQITALCGYPTQDYIAHTLILHIQDYGGSRMEMGYACALATVLFFLMIVCNKLAQKLISKVGD